jgi:hypothetical protein
MSPWDHLCCLGYGIHARWEGLRHILKGHKVHWRDRGDIWSGCTGDIVCETCNLNIWCRHTYWLMWIMQQICGWQGHRELRHPTQGDQPLMDQWYCYRCGADVKKEDK